MDYQLIRSSRRTLAIEIKSSGEVLVRAPYRCSRAEISRFIQAKQDWILRTQEKLVRQRAEAEAAEKLDSDAIRALAEQALAVLPGKVRHFASLAGVSYGRITIRNQRTRWGSCSAEGNLNFNCLLMLTPEKVQDYVVVHELCHRKELNHSARFWQEVERVMPDYRIPRKWLKDHGSAIIARMQ